MWGCDTVSVLSEATTTPTCHTVLETIHKEGYNGGKEYKNVWVREHYNVRVWESDRGGDKSAVTELCFAHVTTKTWEYIEVFGFFRKKNVVNKNSSPPGQITFWKYNEKLIFLLFKYWPKRSQFCFRAVII